MSSTQLTFCLTDEDVQLSKANADHEIKYRGCISVKLQLGRSKFKDVGHSYREPKGLGLTTSKKIAIDNARSHGVELMLLSTEGGDFEDLEQEWDWIPARGKKGRVINFTFYYASRLMSVALELKSVVPTIPVAPAESQAVISQSTRSPSSSPVLVEARHAVGIIDLCAESGEETTTALAFEPANKKRYADENAPGLAGSAAYKRVKIENGIEGACTMIPKTELSEPAQT
ncbi:hypothetical protein LTS14_005806 [Recurvomyces mirabilis]|uniref:uncharacterized protein n=1 Tax=Recurvomyces mirabilis TaxID=574656 RepID=UPI002DDFA7AD|nr:hypothetical protein LTS14_005806 [Recurvomyces mirabilis]